MVKEDYFDTTTISIGIWVPEEPNDDKYVSKVTENAVIFHTNGGKTQIYQVHVIATRTSNISFEKAEHNARFFAKKYAISQVEKLMDSDR